VIGRSGPPESLTAQLVSSQNEEASQRAGFLAELPVLLRELGANPVDVMASAGLGPEALGSQENRFSFVAVGHLLYTCAIQTGVQHFALLVGQRARLSQLGLPGQLARHSPTVRDALRIFAVYQHLNTQGAAISLLERDGVAVLSPVVYQKGADHVEQIYDVCAAAIFAVMRELCGAGWRPERMLFSYAKPAHSALYSRFFQAPCRFDADRTALVFPSSELDPKLATADPELLRRLGAQAQARDDFGIVFRLRRSLRVLLLAQGTSADQVARLLSLHRRTLNRRLRTEGTTFQQLLDEVRFEAACQLLDTSRIPVTEVAASLGYAETSAFTRAFRRWSGFTPVQRRRVSQSLHLQV
jgi:AraC-like DNA-binding protein